MGMPVGLTPLRSGADVMTERAYTIREIAAALKISRSAVAKRAEKGAWPYIVVLDGEVFEVRKIK